MRRALVTTLAVPALLLSACGSDEEPTVDEPSASQTSEQAVATSEQAAQTAEEPTEAATEAPAEDIAEATTEGPSEDTSQSTSGSGDGAGEGGAEGEAAAARTKEFIVALANADPEICNLILDFQGEGPMRDSPENLKVCEDILPTQLEGMMTQEMASVIESVEISGAEVDGDTATVDQDNFSELFAQGFGEQSIGLQKIDGQWYVDLDNSFQGVSSTG